MVSCLGTFGDQMGSSLRPPPQPPQCNKVISKVRKTQHQNPEFGHTLGEIQNQHSKLYVSVQGALKLRKPSIYGINEVSSCLPFIWKASTPATCILTPLTCTTL